MKENDILKMMKLLDVSRDEAIEILQDDEAIDKGEKLFELTPEQKKVEKQMKNTGIKTVKSVDAYGKQRTRTVKEDTDKLKIIDEITKALNAVGCTVVTTNAQRQLDLTFNGRKFRVVLSAPRK